jgi:hypothetical protein
VITPHEERDRIMPELRYKQTVDKSCGAVVLMCAAGELGATTLPMSGWGAALEDVTPVTDDEAREAMWTWDGQEYPCEGFANPQVEKALYVVTGNLNDYSMPSRVVACARHLGLTSKVYLPRGLRTSVLQWCYPQELRKCQEQSDVEVDITPSRGPAQDERELKIVTTSMIGLHYVLRRPAGSRSLFMDPSDGQNFREFQDMNTLVRTYHDTGISIIVRKKT